MVDFFNFLMIFRTFLKYRMNRLGEGTVSTSAVPAISIGDSEGAGFEQFEPEAGGPRCNFWHDFRRLEYLK